MSGVGGGVGGGLIGLSGVSSPIPKKIKIQKSMLFYAFSTYFL